MPALVYYNGLYQMRVTFQAQGGGTIFLEIPGKGAHLVFWCFRHFVKEDFVAKEMLLKMSPDVLSNKEIFHRVKIFKMSALSKFILILKATVLLI